MYSWRSYNISTLWEKHKIIMFMWFPECSSTITALSTSQILSSPNYPDVYGNSLSCIWAIEPEIAGDIVTIVFEDFDVCTHTHVIYSKINFKILWNDNAQMNKANYFIKIIDLFFLLCFVMVSMGHINGNSLLYFRWNMMQIVVMIH